MSRDALRQAARSLAHDGKVTLLSVLLLATTIGAVTAIFAMVEAVLLRPLPVVDQDRIAIAWQRDDRRAVPVAEVTYGQVEDWQSRSRTLSPIAVVGSVNWNLTLVERSGTTAIDVAAVSSSFFRVVGTAPALGRPLEAADEQGTPPTALVISDGLWTRRFGRDPAIAGRSLSVRLDEDSEPVPMRVAGVMPPGFDYPRGAEAWVPAAPLVRRFGAAYHLDAARSIHALGVFYGIGRLRAGVSMEGAAAELTSVMRTAPGTQGEPFERVVLTTLSDHLTGPAGPVLRTLFGGALLMLLIACANVAGLQVSRAARRERATAIQAALGASRRQLVVPVLCESVLLTLAALAGAVLVGWTTLRGLIWLAPAGVFRLDQAALLDRGVLAFAGIVTFATIAACALWPMRVARRVEAVTVLAPGSSRVTGRRGRHLQRAIVVGQVAVALTLLAGTGLFLRTVRGLDATVLGFDPAHLMAFNLSPAAGDGTRWNAAYDAVLRRLETAPGIAAAGAVLVRPLSGPIGLDVQPIYPGQVAGDSKTWGVNPHVNLEVVTPSYFRTMGIALRAGRLFDDRDALNAPGAVIVGEATARRLWPGRDALGQRLAEPTWRGRAAADQPTRWQTVVGVVADVRYRGLNDVRLDMYVPAAQSESRVQYLMVRTAGDTGGAVAAVRAAVRASDPAAAISDAAAMRDVVAAESAPWRFLTQVFVAFASLAALLATIGLGAIVALDVTARRRELAIRAALGADARRLRALVLRDAVVLTALGVVLGLGGALALGRATAHVLIGVRPDDPLTLGGVAGVAAVTCLLAAWLPARTAGRANPLAALRAE